MNETTPATAPRGDEAALGRGPLAGLRVIEFAGKGPGPFAAMMLADMGADVIRVDRPDELGRPARDLVVRGRRSVAVDLKTPAGRDVALDLAERSDVLIEGFRPGVMERLGLGPDQCLARNGRLIYGRMTGWGQDGPESHRAGHDINYIALNGVLSMIGRENQPPTPPLNLVADLGGGGCILAFGVLCALLNGAQTGRGQVVDAAMVDGSALLTTMFHGRPWTDQTGPRGTNMLDSGAPFYDSYETFDGRWMSVGAIEPAFYAAFAHGLDLTDAEAHPQMDRSTWAARKALVADRFRTRTQREWIAVFAPLDACVTPLLAPSEAMSEPHLATRATFIEISGVSQPAPAPRFSESELAVPTAPPCVGQHTNEVLREAGFSDKQLSDLATSGAVRQADSPATERTAS